AITPDTTVVASDGVVTTGIIASPKFALYTSASTQYAFIAGNNNLGQTTTYTIPDPGTTTANFILDAGTQTIGGNKTFSGTTTMAGLSVSGDLSHSKHILTTSTIGSSPTNDNTMVTSAFVSA